MGISLEKQHLFIHTPRLFVREGQDAYSLINFIRARDEECETETESFTGMLGAALERPDNWSSAATELFATHATLHALPDQLHPQEENTVPSWLWQQQRRATASETSVCDVFDRVVGSATFKGWKQKLFADESAARSFYEEARYALAQRFIAIAPHVLAEWGVEWAYGVTKAPHTPTPAPTNTTSISNSEIDAVVAGTAPAATRKKWQQLKLSAQRPHHTIIFHDTDMEWVTRDHAQPAIATIDLMAFRNDTGSVDSEKLRHAVRLLTVLFDLQGDENADYSFGFDNIATLLLAQALPYDSTAGRALAAAIAAFITAEAYHASAELAAIRGTHPAFTAQREKMMRILRNHARAAHGDRTDFEKISVLPESLILQDCPDLTLAAAAQNAWADAVRMAQEHGLRNLAPTNLNHSAPLTLFIEASATGTAPLATLTRLVQNSDEGFSKEIHPAIMDALLHLSASASDKDKVRQHILGHHALDKCPTLNHAALRAAGFDRATITRVENYLPQVNSVRLAFTPWVVGEDFCRDVLHIPAKKIQSFTFDLLHHLGFDDAAVAAANLYVYGEDNVQNVHGLSQHYKSVLARACELPARAVVTMAAALQSFVAATIPVEIALPATASTDYQATMMLDAWRSGLRSVTLIRDARLAPIPTQAATMTANPVRATRRTKNSFLMAKPPALPNRSLPNRTASQAKSGNGAGAGTPHRARLASITKPRGTSLIGKRG